MAEPLIIQSTPICGKKSNILQTKTNTINVLKTFHIAVIKLCNKMFKH